MPQSPPASSGNRFACIMWQGLCHMSQSSDLLSNEQGDQSPPPPPHNLNFYGKLRFTWRS